MKLFKPIFYLLLFFYFSINISAQTSIECKKDALVDKSGVCKNCSAQDELFTGLLVTRNDLRRKIYAPFKTKIYQDKWFKIEDAYGNSTTLDIANTIGYSNKDSLLNYLEGCTLGGIGGAIEIDTNSFVRTSGDQTISGEKTFSGLAVTLENSRVINMIPATSFMRKDEIEIMLASSGTDDNLGNHTATQDINMNFNKISSLAEPTLIRDATTKQYVDGLISANSDDITDHTSTTTGNPHNVTKSDVGLSNADNTSDLNKPISTATQTALDSKQNTLVSGTSIKTINNQSLLGSGNISISGGTDNLGNHTATQALNMSNNIITNLSDPITSDHAVNLGYITDANYASLGAGQSFTGNNNFEADLTISDRDIPSGSSAVMRQDEIKDLININKVDKFNTLEYISKNALIVYDTFVPGDTFGIANDFAIMPNLFVSSKTGHMFFTFRTSDDHFQSTTMNTVVMKSADGGETWTGLDGTGRYSLLPTSPTVGRTLDINGGGFTPTGRWVLFPREFTDGSFVRNMVMYSDDEGLTWSTPTVLDAGNQIGYMYDNQFVLGKNNELIFGQRTINDGAGSTRYVRYYHSFDNGTTWSRRSVALNNSDTGYNFGEVITRDLGSGTFIAMVRLAADNQDGQNYPFLMVSKDYGLTWDHENNQETLSFTDIYNGVSNSGFLPLEGEGNKLGEAIANKSCLPHLEIHEKHGQKYLVIPYYIRDNGTVQDRWRMQVINYDGWMVAGKKAIVDTAWIEFFTGQYGGLETNDGNGQVFFPNNGGRGLFITCDNIGIDYDGPSIVIIGRVPDNIIETVIANL